MIDARRMVGVSSIRLAFRAQVGAGAMHYLRQISTPDDRRELDHFHAPFVAESVPRDRCGHAQRDGPAGAGAFGLGAFVAQECQGQVDALDLAQPSLGFGPRPPGKDVGLELLQAGQHLWVNEKDRAPYTGLTELILNRFSGIWASQVH
jgi:hypothetical protein